MQAKRFVWLAAVVGVLAGLWFVWRSLDSATAVDPRGDARTELASSPAANARADLDRDRDVERATNELERTTVAISAADPARDEQNFALDGARWIEGKVVVPAGAPADETLAVWAVDLHGDAASDAPTGRVFFGNREDPSAVLDELAGAGKSARWSHRLVQPDGSFRVPAPADATMLQLVLDGRYLYLETKHAISAGKEGEPQTLEALLGAWFVGRCTPPASATSDEVAAGADVQMFGYETRPGREGTVQRKTRATKELAFELRGLPPLARYFLTIEPARMATARDTDLEAKPGQKIERTYALAMGARVRGRVLDADAKPVAGASVRAESTRPSRRATRVPFGSGGRERSVQSAPDGSFELFGIEAGRTKLSATLEGFVRADDGERELADGAVVDGVELRLGSGTEVAGKVTFPDGRPAADARISVREAPERATRGSRAFAPPAEHAKNADASGAFRFTGLGDGPFTVNASFSEPRTSAKDAPAKPEGEGDDAPSATASETIGARVWVAEVAGVPAGSKELLVVLVEPSVLRGRVVTDDGAPVRAFQVSANADWRKGRPVDASSHAQRFEDKQGRFALDGLPAGSWRIGVEAKGYAIASEPPVVELPSNDELVLTVSRASKIRGVVTDPLGLPIAKATVRRRSTGNANPWSGLGRDDDARTDAQGRFELAGVPPGAWDVDASSEAWAKSASVSVTVPPGQDLDGVAVVLRRGGVLEGEVFDARGGHAQGRNVQLFTMAGDARQAKVDASGRFREEHLTPGTYQVMLEPAPEQIDAMADKAGEGADPSDFLSSMKMTSCAIEDGQTTHVVLGAPPKSPVHVHGRVTRGGEPMTTGSIVVLNEGGALMQNMKFGKLSGDGRYEVTLDKPGDVVLVVARQMGANDGIEFYLSIPEVAEFEHDLVLPRCSIRGVVRGPDARPLAGVHVTLARDAAASNLLMMGGPNGARTDADGRFAFEDLNPGVYAVAAGGTSSSPFGGDATPYGRAVKGGLVVEADKSVEGVVLELETPGSITGFVRDASGKPVSGATIFARDKRGELMSRFGTVTSDATGKFEYAGLAPGAYTLSARTKTLAARDGAAIDVRAGSASKADVAMDTGTILRISTVDGADKSVRASLRIQDEAGFEVSGQIAMDAMMDLVNEGVSTSERKFGPLAPGKYVVVATTNDGKSAKKPVTLSGQDERKLKVRID